MIYLIWLMLGIIGMFLLRVRSTNDENNERMREIEKLFSKGILMSFVTIASFYLISPLFIIFFIIGILRK